MISAFGFKPELRKPYTFNPAPFIANPKSGQQGYITSEPFAVEREGGFKPDIYMLSDAGFSTYATTVETMQETIDETPDVVKCFVEGSAIGWANYLYGDPSPADEMIQADNPDMSDEQLEFSRNAMKEYGIVDSGDALELGIGGMTDATIKDFYDKMVAAGVVGAGAGSEQGLHAGFLQQRRWAGREEEADGVNAELQAGAAAPLSAAAAREARAPLLSIRNVTKVFGRDVVALRGMSLNVRQGDFISLLGPSGCGKSTALRLIAGLMHPTSGRIEWADGPGAQDGGLGVVFQEPTLMPWATVEKNAGCRCG